MGYPVAYRTSAAREVRQLSRPPTEPAPRSPANDNKPYPMRPANDNFPGHLPPKAGGWVKHPAVRKAAQTIMMAHPLLRAFSLGWKLYDLYDGLSRVKTYEGEGMFLKCSVSYSDMCASQTPCGLQSYCGGPVFFDAINQALCGLGGQGYGFNAQGYPPNHGQVGGIFVQLIRPGFPFCQPAGVLRQWESNAYYPFSRVRRLPQWTPWHTTTPAPFSPFRFYKPQVFMKPGDPVEVTPMPPPYEYIPSRSDADMWPGERGYSAGEAIEPVAPPAFRAKPGPRVKEKKVKWTGPAQMLHAILVSISRVHGKLLDLRDILGAMNDALPKELQVKGASKKALPDLLRNVWQNLDKMDGEKALAGIIKEIAEDVVGGASDMLRKEAASKFGWMKTKVYTSPRF